LEEVDSDDELQAARSLAAKKATVLSGLDAQVRYRRLAGMLGRRGFNPGVINQVVNETFRSGDH
jgi:regulatory protein